MLPWVYVFGVYKERLKLLRWRRRRWRKKINDAEDEWEEDEKFGTKGKSNRWREGDFSTVMNVIRDERDWKLINFQLLVLFSLFRNRGGGCIAGVELVMIAKLNSWDFIISKVINGLHNFGFILIFK